LPAAQAGLDYVGRDYGKDVTVPQTCRFALGVYNKLTGKLQVRCCSAPADTAAARAREQRRPGRPALPPHRAAPRRLPPPCS
jgi:hypothetical protein